MEKKYEEMIGYGMKIHAKGKKVLCDFRLSNCFDVDFPMFISEGRDIFISLPVLNLEGIEVFLPELLETFSLVKTTGYNDEYGDTVEIYKYALISKVGSVNGDNPENEIFYIMKEILLRTNSI